MPPRKLRLILAASSRAGTARLLRAWHDEVLFCCAYPDDAALRRAAEHELRRLGRLARARTSAEGSPLHNSGIAGTTVTASFSPTCCAGWWSASAPPSTLPGRTAPPGWRSRSCYPCWPCRLKRTDYSVTGLPRRTGYGMPRVDTVRPWPGCSTASRRCN